MKYISGLYTDVGIKKKTNQDSMLLQHADTDYGEAVFAVVCDGMGGLKKGEVASADVIYAFSNWFKEDFPSVVVNGAVDAVKLGNSWLELIRRRDDEISRYGAYNGINLGTTMVCMLIYSDNYYIANIGDSRAYLLSDRVYQITHDHTLIQQKIDQGQITIEQAQTDPQRSVLLQCIGASDYIEPDFFSGTVEKNVTFLLCCDGFRHVIQPSEIYASLKAKNNPTQAAIEANLKELTNTIKSRGETDNISALVIRSC